MKGKKLLLTAALTCFMALGFASVAKAADGVVTVSEVSDISMSQEGTSTTLEFPGVAEGSKVTSFTLEKPGIVKINASVLLNSTSYTTFVQCYYKITRDEAGVDIVEKEEKKWHKDKYEKELYMEAGTYYFHTRWTTDKSEMEKTYPTQKVANSVTVQYVERNGGVLGSSKDTASTLEANVTATGFCTEATPWQIYKFVVNKDSDVNITAAVVSMQNASGINGNYSNQLIITDNKGKQIAEDSARVERGAGSSISAKLSAGTYYFTFKPYQQGITNTTLEVTAQPVCSLSWKKVKGAKNYRVFMYNDSTHKYEMVSQQRKTSYKMTSSKSVMGSLERDVEYDFQICAYGKGGTKLKEFEVSVVAK